MNEKNEKIVLDVAYQPQIRTTRDTRSLMLDVIIALLPVLIVAVWQFGTYPLLVVACSVAACVFFEWGYRKLMHKETSIGDLSAVVTGMLLGLSMPSTAPCWIPVVGAFFAIVVVKQLYGGLGKNFLNPALAGRAFLLSSYSLAMGNWAVPNSLKGIVDGVSMATPLSYLYGDAAMPKYFGLTSLFLGNTPGSMGEVSSLILLAGCVYLIARKVISWRIPVSFIGTVGLLTLIFGPVQHVLRRADSHRRLHGDRLQHQPRHQERPAALWLWLRRDHGADPLLRRFPRGHDIRDPDYEPVQLGH